MSLKVLALFPFFLLFAGFSAFCEQIDATVQTSENGSATAATVQTDNIPFGKIDPAIAQIAYSGDEKFFYDITWTGGLKIGELRLEIKKVAGQKDTYEIHAWFTTDNGMFKYIYPVKDTHVTTVKGDGRLPVYYEVWQKEGYSYTAHRMTRYEQQEGKIIYQKEGDPIEEFFVNGTTYNEFSSFFVSRVMPLVVGKPFKVPTYADEKRNEVVVETMRKTHIEDTIIGPVDTVEVMPILTFTGLYDKRGDTVIWYTDDECRVPVLINSKIVIGSLTSTLVYYSNPACEKYNVVQTKNVYHKVRR
jgi:hypothetical protein